MDSVWATGAGAATTSSVGTDGTDAGPFDGGGACATGRAECGRAATTTGV